MNMWIARVFRLNCRNFLELLILCELHDKAPCNTIVSCVWKTTFQFQIWCTFYKTRYKLQLRVKVLVSSTVYRGGSRQNFEWVPNQRLDRSRFVVLGAQGEAPLFNLFELQGEQTFMKLKFLKYFCNISKLVVIFKFSLFQRFASMTVKHWKFCFEPSC